ncbi:MAG: sensor histidine kinase, partial [Nonomuraea sp.]|nr:sensor histidine kinase [Nonomuraea sp.]
MSDLPVVRELMRLPPLALDAALAVLVLLAQLAPFLTGRGSWDWWGYAVVVVASVPVLWRRRAPVLGLMVSLLVIPPYDLGDPVPNQPVWYACLVLMYTVATRSSRWPRILSLVLAVGGALVLVGSSATAVRGALGLLTAYAVGRATTTSRAERDRLERERELAAERAEHAAAQERARIARDMHDILAHAVSLMVVQAEAGPVVVRSAPERAEAAFDAIAASGRDAMVQLRRMLGVLKEGEPPREPQPGIAELRALAVPGLVVDLVERGEPRTVPQACAVAAYRVTQEALTNIVKHSGASRAEIRLTWEDANLMIDILDEGTGTARDLPAGGHGL